MAGRDGGQGIKRYGQVLILAGFHNLRGDPSAEIPGAYTV
jgi:hypothetical protein